MSDLTVGTTIAHGGQSFRVTELVDYFPHEVIEWENKRTEGERNPLLLGKLLCNFSPKARSLVKERAKQAGDISRDERLAIIASVPASFPKEVAIVQAAVKANAPEHIARTKAAAIARFENDDYHMRCRIADLVESGPDAWTLAGDISYPAVGNPVSHDSQLDFQITQVDGAFTTFARDDGREVMCSTDDLVWFEEDKAWMLVGRLLSRSDRDQWKALVGSPWPPNPEAHPEARKTLRDAGLME